MRDRITSSSERSLAGDGEARSLSPFQEILCCVLFLAGAAAIIYAQSQWMKYSIRIGFRWILVGVLLVAVAGSITPLRRNLSTSGRSDLLRTAEKWFLVVLVLGGGLLRFVALDRFPPGGFHDEVQYHRFAEGILAGQRPVFIPDAPMPAFYFYLLAAAIKVAGRGLATVRGVSAFLGTLTLPAFYFLARRAFAWPVAAASALLLAGSRWHITFSRVVFSPAIIVPLLEVLALLCLWKAMETGAGRQYVLLGVVMGIGLQTYYSFNFFPAVLLVAVVSYAARLGWQTFGRELSQVAKGLAWSVLVAGILLIPLAGFALHNREAFFRRSNAVAIWNPVYHLPWPGALWTNTVSHLLMFNFVGDSNQRHNIPGAPLLDPIAGVLLVIGLGLALARAVRWPQATWLAWFAVMLLPAILTIEAPQAHRAVGAIPAVYLLIGEGLRGLHAIGTHRAGRLRAGLVGALVLGLSVAAASTDVYRYFRVQLRDPLVWQAFEADYHEIARFVLPFRDRYEIRVSGKYAGYPILTFRLGEGFPYEPFHLPRHLPFPPGELRPRSEGVLYVLEPFLGELFPLFQTLYPHARFEEHRDPFGRVMFVSIRVPRAEVESPANAEISGNGFFAAYYPNGRWEGEPAIVRKDPSPLFHFHWTGEALPDPFTADWSASLRVDQPGEYAFDLATSGPTLLLVDGQTIFSTHDVDQTNPRKVVTFLSRGDHVLVLRYRDDSYASIISLLWEPPGGKQSVIPLRLLRPLQPEEYRSLRGRLPLPEIQ